MGDRGRGAGRRQRRPRQRAGWPANVEVDIGYGLALADGRGLLTPYGGLVLGGPGHGALPAGELLGREYVAGSER